MKPSCTVLSEDLFPIDVGGFHLRNGGLAAVGAAESGADAESALDEVEAIADGAADAIVRNPTYNLVYTALIHQVFDKSADRVIRQRSNVRGFEVEATLQAAGNVIFATALEDLKVTRGGDAVVAGIEAQHDF